MKKSEGYCEEDFGWCKMEIPQSLIIDYTDHYITLTDTQVVAILHEYMKEALRYQNIGIASAASMVALVREVKRRMDGKLDGISYDHDMFLIDFCKRYANLIHAGGGCVSIW